MDIDINACYEIAVATIFLGGLMENYITANPNEDALDIINPEQTLLNILARRILEIKGVSAGLLGLNQNILSGGAGVETGPNIDTNKEDFVKFLDAFNKLPQDKQDKIKKIQSIIRDTFCRQPIAIGGKKRKTNRRRFKKRHTRTSKI